MHLEAALAVERPKPVERRGREDVHDRGVKVGPLRQTVLVDHVMVNATTYTFETEVDPSDKEKCTKGGWQDFTSSPGPSRTRAIA